MLLAAPKSSLHALQTCQKLDIVWDASEFWDFRHQTQFLDFRAIISWDIQHNKNPELFAMIVWSIWNQRNQSHLHLPSCSVDRITHVARDRYEEHRVVLLAP